MPPYSRPSAVPLSRRDVLRAAASGAALIVAPAARAQAPPPPAVLIQNTLGDGQRFDPAVVVDLARQLSRRPYVAPAADLPDVFTNLNLEQYGAIRAQPSAFVWAGENRGIVVEPLHRGSFYSNQVALFAVEEGQVRRISYDRTRFEFGRLNVPVNVGDIGFSGVRLHWSPVNGQLADFALVQGATFFRARARGQDYGIVARALTLRPAEARGEEFPRFRACWLERPGAGVAALTMHAIFDSESVAGALRMTWRPGEMAIVDVEQTLFPRVDLDHVGLAGMGASYLFGPNDRRTDDVRPAVYEVSGLQMLNGHGEWLWRPLHNPDRLQISAFIDRNPKGFGLIQRDRDYVAFQDDVERWERRPSLWIEPLGEWGEGVVQLIEIPSDAEANDNILAYWRPKGVLTAGSGTSLAYRQFWAWTPPERPPLATVAATRVGRGSAGRRRRFLVDFTGGKLAPAPADLKPVLTTSPGAIHGVRLWPYPDRQTVRVAFELDPGNENACEMRLLLETGGRPLTETWLYRWTP